MSDHVQISRSPEHEGIAIITIDRPPRNAMSLQAHRELLALSLIHI